MHIIERSIIQVMFQTIQKIFIIECVIHVLNHKSTNKYLALFAFITSLIIYVLTMAPTASFGTQGIHGFFCN